MPWADLCSEPRGRADLALLGAVHLSAGKGMTCSVAQLASEFSPGSDFRITSTPSFCYYSLSLFLSVFSFCKEDAPEWQD